MRKLHEAWRRFLHWLRYRRCDLCLKEARRPLYRDSGDLGYYMCFECAWVNDEL